MSKTNLLILAATGLLGVLLYVVLDIVGQVPLAPGPAHGPKQAASGAAAVGPSHTTTGEGDSGESASFARLLAGHGVDAAVTIRRYSAWLQQRGFLGTEAQLGIRYEQAPARYYESLDDAALKSRATAGSMGALQELATRALPADPIRAIKLYREAIALGSTFAMLRIASLMDMFSEMDHAGRGMRRDYAPQMKRLRLFSGDGDLKKASLAWVLAAIRDGGAAVARPDVRDWIKRTTRHLLPEAVDSACERSVDIIVQAGFSRRAKGHSPVSIEPPPVFLRPADLYDRLPCQDSAAPIKPLVSAGECAVDPVRNARGEPRQLWICKAS